MLAPAPKTGNVSALRIAFAGATKAVTEPVEAIMKVTVDLYTPSEAEIATGRNVENQRNDRRSGYDPQPAGHARYDLVGLSRLLIRQQFADSGIGPARSMPIIDKAAAEVAKRASYMSGTWTPRAMQWGDRVHSGPKQGESLVERVFGGEAIDAIAEGVAIAVPFAPVALKDLLRDSDYVVAGGSSGFVGGIVVWPDGTYSSEEVWYKAPGELSPRDPRNMGLIKGFSYYHMAQLLVSRLPRPFFDISTGEP